MQRGKGKGFTLIELLIVVAIIAILALIAVPNFLEAQVRAKVARSKNDQRSLHVAIQALRVDTNVLLIDFWDDDQDWSNPNSVMNVRLHETLGCATQDHDNRGGVAGVLVPLTTPIAYTTSFPLDPFATDDNQGSFWAGTEPVLIMADRVRPYTYMYMDDESTWEPTRDHGSDLMDRHGTGWQQYAVRPIKLDEFVTMGLGPTKGSAYTRYGVLYDPTNGTASRGEIIRYSD
jgi:prepilin-type N-terminal cleavage/methylation domain-containing protein